MSLAVIQASVNGVPDLPPDVSQSDHSQHEAAIQVYATPIRLVATTVPCSRCLPEMYTHSSLHNNAAKRCKWGDCGNTTCSNRSARHAIDDTARLVLRQCL